MAAFDQNKLDTLQGEADTLSSNLSDSPTAYTTNVSPSGSDLSTDAKLAGVQSAIEKLKGQRIRDQWYGPASSATPESGPKEGLISKGLTMLGKPLDAIVGAAEWATGTGSKRGLFENINANLSEHDRFGNILKKKGITSPWVTLPLGFALDVMFDPVNWATAGTAALIPRVGAGLVKGTMRGGLTEGIQAAKTGLVSSLEKKALTAERFVPKFGFGNAEKYKNFIDTVGEHAIAGAKKYDEAIGSDVYSKLGKNFFGFSDLNAVDPITGLNTPKTFGASLENAVRSRIPKGDALVESIKYSPAEYNKMVAVKDRVGVLGMQQGLNMTRDIKGKNVIQNIDEIYDKSNPETLRKQLSDHLMRNAEEGVQIEIPKVADTLENAVSILKISGEDLNSQNLMKYLEKAYEPSYTNKTGIKFYDSLSDKIKTVTAEDILSKTGLSGAIKSTKRGEKFYEKVKDTKPFEAFLNTYANFIGAFKLAKVAASPQSFGYAIPGNFTMGFMMGVPVMAKEYLSNVLGAWNFLRGRGGAAYVRDTFFNDLNSFQDLLMKNPELFRNITGLNVGDIHKGISEIRGLNMGSTFEDVRRILVDEWQTLGQTIKDTAELEARETKSVFEKMMGKGLKQKPSAFKTVEKLKSGGTGIRAAEMQSSLPGAEFTESSWMNKLKENIAAKKSKGVSYWIADKVLNAMPDAYSHVDQAFKLGTIKTLTHRGITESDLIKMSRFVHITKDDLLDPVREGGELLYRLTPQKAAEVAGETYMNYAAMPSMVKMLRTLPILGLPFVSFPYAMAVKGGKTLLHNPAAFTKIQSLMNEVQGEKSPMEKKSLEDKYNSYLKSPGMVKLFNTMTYLNTANAIPYLSMNIFSPSERRYGDTFGDKFAQFIDNTPFMKDPVGQVLWDYFVQPTLLAQGEQPQGSFGQPLYPIGSSFGVKSLYALRSGAESLVPGVAAYAGIPAGLSGLPPEATQFVPSYRFRSLANAVQGRDTLGVQTTTDAWNKTMKALLSSLGIQLHSLDTNFLSKQNKPKK